MNNTAKIKALDDLYATLPKIECQRKCQACCSHIGMLPLERKRLERQVGPLKFVTMRCDTQTGGQSLGVHNIITGDCPMLKDGACIVYTIRPAICRLWGLTEKMKCPFGCLPERMLSEVEAFEFMRTVLRISL